MDAHQEASTTLKILIMIFVLLMVGVLGYMVLNSDILEADAMTDENSVLLRIHPSTETSQCDKLNTTNNNCN